MKREKLLHDTRVGVIKSRQFAGACTIIALSIFVIARREVNGVILPLARGSSANREIVTMRVRVIIRSSDR